VEVENRKDVLVYTSRTLDEDLRVTGPVVAKLWIASSAPDTDFTAKLVDVAPDGRAINLTDGIQRVAYRNSNQTVFHDARHASRLLLPVLPNDQGH